MFFYLGLFALTTPSLLYALPAIFREPDANLNGTTMVGNGSSPGEGMETVSKTSVSKTDQTQHDGIIDEATLLLSQEQP